MPFRNLGRAGSRACRFLQYPDPPSASQFRSDGWGPAIAPGSWVWGARPCHIHRASGGQGGQAIPRRQPPFQRGSVRRISRGGTSSPTALTFRGSRPEMLRRCGAGDAPGTETARRAESPTGPPRAAPLSSLRANPPPDAPISFSVPAALRQRRVTAGEGTGCHGNRQRGHSPSRGFRLPPFFSRGRALPAELSNPAGGVPGCGRARP